jgi:hypothetical protein
MEIVVVVPDLPNGGNINELPPRAVGCWRLFFLGFSCHRQQTFFPPKIEKSALFSCQTLCYLIITYVV